MADDKSQRDESGEQGLTDESAGKSAKPTRSSKDSASSKTKDTKAKATKTADKSAGKTKAKAPSETRTGPVTFYRQVVAELRKVVWPTREQLVTYFFVVMIFVLVMIALVSLLDLGFGKLVFAVFGGADDV